MQVGIDEPYTSEMCKAINSYTDLKLLDRVKTVVSDTCKSHPHPVVGALHLRKIRGSLNHAVPDQGEGTLFDMEVI